MRRAAVATVGLALCIGGAAAALGRVGPSRAAPVAGSTAAGLDGAQLFAAKGCATCHAGPGSTAMAGVGPSLAEAARWAGTRRPGMDAATYLGDSMRDPGGFRSPASTSSAVMPVLTLTDDEIDRLVEHLLGG
ncbi:MAG: c-type cytochrome [Ilumatobacteraceae bacterium]